MEFSFPSLAGHVSPSSNFLSLDGRFSNQLERSFARQIMKCSSDKHWAVQPAEPTKNEKRFMAEQNIQRLDVPLGDFGRALMRASSEAGQALAANA